MASQLETLSLEHLPQGYKVHLALFHEVKNAEFLQRQLLEGNTEFEYAFLDAGMIISKTHLLASIFRAINDSLNARLRSRNVHSETVFCLSPNNNIAQSFKTFGIQPSSTSVIAVKIAVPESSHNAESVQQHLAQHVEGKQVSTELIGRDEEVDLARVKKVYKIVLPARKGDQNVLTEMEKKEVECQVLAAMALRGAS